MTQILTILQELGADIRTVNRTTVDIDCSHIRNARVPDALARKIRASYYLIGAMLSRFGSAEVPLPGGCDFGGRPIDQHIKGFSSRILSRQHPRFFPAPKGDYCQVGMPG